MEALRKLYRLLTHREKILGGVLVGMFFISSLLEVAGLGFIFVYVKLILDPTQIQAFAPLTWLQHLTGFDTKHFLVFLGALLLAVLGAKTLMAVVCAWASYRYSMARLASFSVDLFRIYLFKDYIYFLNKNSATLKQNVLDETHNVIFNVFVPMLYILSEMLALAAIVLLLLLLHPMETLIMFAIMGTCFGLYLLLVRKRLDVLSRQKSSANRDRYRIVNDAFASVKEIIIWDAKWSFVRKFRTALRQFAYSMAWNHILLQIPRYLVEAVGFFLIVALMMYQLLHSHTPAEIIAMIALYGAAGMRMMPSFNRIAMNGAQVRFHKRSLYAFYNDLVQRHNLLSIPDHAQDTPDPLPFEKTIAYDQVSFAYSKGGEDVIHNLSLVIHKRSSVAFVGASGAGKSTLVDLLLGLVHPDIGDVRVDGAAITPMNIDAWRQQIGYIPQRVVLLDDSVSANVAFGAEDEQIDMERVRWACSVAKIDTFIEQELKDGYDTTLGEHGIRLSGGQAQRIAIARALYRKPSILIMDEATAALDGITEREITETLEELAGKLTIITIAHRLNTVKHCDMIYLFRKGQIADWGTYAALLERNEEFKKMAN